MLTFGNGNTAQIVEDNRNYKTMYDYLLNNENVSMLYIPYK